ncbi:hypothetical protein PR202_ga09350 [Eleusine coracana subsp. coracana]|uniref:Purple acid phosphatase n=1 Tax=Eleusine coracana subsp. coracana TaxID=191504 RepID=A0AAV5C3J3_ELECO|nr:hypothetical protein PR202_ga09350 [Eleusine coracana subsp. coracana]
MYKKLITDNSMEAILTLTEVAVEKKKKKNKEKKDKKKKKDKELQDDKVKSNKVKSAPIDAQHLTSDPGYLGCKNVACQKRDASGGCRVRTCAATLTFHVVNFRTDVEFVLFSGGFRTPCVLKRSGALRFANPAKPLYGHLSSTDSKATSMRLTWVSGDARPQQVQYAGGMSAISQVATFTQKDMCSVPVLPSPAKDFGWHDPGYIHSAVMTGLQPSQSYTYRYGSDFVGWSETIKFRTPPAAGSDELSFVIFGDMGKAPHDPSVEHYIQPGSITVTNAVAKEIQTRKVDSIFHIGDISYATGFLVEWDFFLHLITPLASQVPYMTAIGNHERDYADSGSVYVTPDSGGECGVAYESYFPMPIVSKDKPWYSIEQGSVHFVVMSTEHKWSEKSEQYNWMNEDLSSVNRSRTPWVIFIGHRPMYSSHIGITLNVDPIFLTAVEPLLLKYQVDLVFFGHVHNYERSCAIYQRKCRGMPKKDASGIDTYDNSNYTAPVHAIVGAGGFSLDNFPKIIIGKRWSLSRVSEFGYARVHATRTDILVQDLKDLISNCQQYVQFPADPKIPPSQACCAVIQRANIPCLCSKVTPPIEGIICMDKVVYVANYCKRPLQPGSNCGSYHVPGGPLA